MNENQFKFLMASIKESNLEEKDLYWDFLESLQTSLVSLSDCLEYISNRLIYVFFGEKCNKILKKDEKSFIFCINTTNYFESKFNYNQKCSKMWFSLISSLFVLILKNANISTKVSVLDSEKTIVLFVEFIL